MKTDPRAACVNTEERLFWALVHDGLAHPFMALTHYSSIAVRFHNFTSLRAWPRVTMKPKEWFKVSSRHGLTTMRNESAGFYAVKCPFLTMHTVVVKAADRLDALDQANVWFDGLSPPPEVCTHSSTIAVSLDLNDGADVECKFCHSQRVKGAWRMPKKAAA